MDSVKSWTFADVQAELEAFEGSGPIVVLANREPVRHDHAADGSIAVTGSASGLLTTLVPLIEASSGVWVAHGAGTADRLVTDRHDRLNVPPANPRYRLRRVWLDAAEEQGYYYGFANEGLWPLCHRAGVAPVFRANDFSIYRTVNERFAAAVCEEVNSEWPLILVQDYHFALAPRLIRERLPYSTLVAFWHVPWPHARVFAACPWGRELVEGLLGSSVIGFQTLEDADNFLQTVQHLTDACVDRTRRLIAYRNRLVAVRAYPVSVQWPNRDAHDAPPVEMCQAAVRRGLRPDVRLAVGVDRLDYTKGLEQKCLAVERLLELHPEFQGRFVLVQIAEPSRNRLPAYQACRATLVRTVDRINSRFGEDGYEPIVLLEAHHDAAAVYQYLRAADICYVGSLHDGMNLVAKEFVAARDDHRGVLVLSRFAGAAIELTDALIINPYVVDDAAHALAQALTMTEAEQAMRVRAMRAVVARRNSYRWVGRMLRDAARLRPHRGAHPTRLAATHAAMAPV